MAQTLISSTLPGKVVYSDSAVKLTVPIPQSWVRCVYDIPKGWGGTRKGASSITNQITDHFTPYCGELQDSAINNIRVLDEC